MWYSPFSVLPKWKEMLAMILITNWIIVMAFFDLKIGIIWWFEVLDNFLYYMKKGTSLSFLQGCHFGANVSLLQIYTWGKIVLQWNALSFVGRAQSHFLCQYPFKIIARLLPWWLLVKQFFFLSFVKLYLKFYSHTFANIIYLFSG